jgi:hypothetical protein
MDLQDGTHLARFLAVLLLINWTEAARKNEGIPASEITHLVHRNIVPRYHGPRDRSDEKAIREEAIEHNFHVITPPHSSVDLAPIIWATASIHELMCDVVDGVSVLDAERAVTLHDSNIVPLVTYNSKLSNSW